MPRAGVGRELDDKGPGATLGSDGLSYIFVVAVIILITVLLKTHKNHTLFTSKLYCM